MPTDVTGRDPVAVGRIRRTSADPNALSSALCGDQIREGRLPSSAIQIAELLLPSSRPGRHQPTQAVAGGCALSA